MDPSIIAASVVTVIVAATTAVVTIISTLAQSEDRRQAKIAREKADASALEAEKKAATIINATTQIHELANSRLSAVTSELKIANERIEGLQKLIASLIEARTAAVAAMTPAVVPGVARAPEVVEALSTKVDHNIAVSTESRDMLTTIVDPK